MRRAIFFSFFLILIILTDFSFLFSNDVTYRLSDIMNLAKRSEKFQEITLKNSLLNPEQDILYFDLKIIELYKDGDFF